MRCKECQVKCEDCGKELTVRKFFFEEYWEWSKIVIALVVGYIIIKALLN